MKNIELCELTETDAEFIFKLLTQPSFKANIGDKGVIDLKTALTHLKEKYIASYKEFGYGLWGIRDKDLNCFVGVCGLVSRPDFEVPDLGYALLDEYTKQGYVDAAAKMSIAFARGLGNLTQLNAITSPSNQASINVLEKLGFKFEKQFTLTGYEGVSNLYQLAL
ncbi:GNAT family N-acetyltransferase [Pseudoalteromonas sp.]|uniref:GNAT family N-acetyltransferase n=1 Tax=Pseudoalteromonas sp. TaxID=53249 RepID=UPI0035630D7F